MHQGRGGGGETDGRFLKYSLLQVSAYIAYSKYKAAYVKWAWSVIVLIGERARHSSGGKIARGEAECYFAALPKTSAIYPRISRLPVL